MTARTFNRIALSLAVLMVVLVLARLGEGIFVIIALTPVAAVGMAIYTWLTQGTRETSGEATTGEATTSAVDKGRIPVGDFLKLACIAVFAVALLMIAAAIIDSGQRNDQDWKVAAGLAVIVVPGVLMVLRTLVCMLNQPLSWLLPRLSIAIATRIGGRHELYRGVFAVEAGRIEEGSNIIERYAATNPGDPEVYLGRASVFMARHDLDQAADAIRQSLEIESTPPGLHMRAVVRMIVGDCKGALDDCEESLSRQPRSMAVKGVRCACLVALRRLDTAVEESTSLRRTWGNAGVALILGEAHRLLGEQSAAETWVKDALALAKSCQHPHPKHHDIVGWCLAIQGDLDGAVQAVEAALEIDIENPIAHLAASLVALKKGDMAAVEASFNAMSATNAVCQLQDPLFTPLLAQQRFRDLLAQAMDESRREREEVLRRLQIGVRTTG